ncbi:MAG: hypothetical protein ACJ8AT_29455 [Hyalangium sp.]|uniref:hypothetical protein n=1 Tax=Hyalangium sp. TaxID=2028555 RepID=UPI00389A42F1
MFERSEIHKGMTVRSIDGHKLGRIVELKDEELIVEKGLLRRRDFAVRLSDVREVAHGEVFLHHGQDSLFAAPRELPSQPHARGWHMAHLFSRRES